MSKNQLCSYTKKTFAKLQKNYCYTIQGYNAKLKEKHDKIEELEKSNHNRELKQK